MSHITINFRSCLELHGNYNTFEHHHGELCNIRYTYNSLFWTMNPSHSPHVLLSPIFLIAILNRVSTSFLMCLKIEITTWTIYKYFALFLLWSNSTCSFSTHVSGSMGAKNDFKRIDSSQKLIECKVNYVRIHSCKVEQ